MTLYESLFKKVDTILQVNAYFPLKDIILDQLLECLQKVPSVKDTMSTHLKILLNTHELENTKIPTTVSPDANDLKTNNDIMPIIKDDPLPNVSKIEELKLINNVGSVSNVAYSEDLKQIQHGSNKCSFTAPPAKKLRKKGPNIVNTVMENGEEYVVVKSNWKFNPKNLTENQKEKLKKKREDIPALYQDLSQSQDEFKITAWKPDSQDSSTTSSKSASKSATEDVSTILKNMPSSEVVPKIMESILLDTTKETVEKEDEKICNDCSPKQAPAVKEPKTPRLALKDRVFRNVRTLMEKSGIRNENEISFERNNTISETNITPNAKTNISASMVNSAPSKIHPERPSRVIKTPKKFEDSKVFALRKRRRSLTGSQSHISESFSIHEKELNREENTDDNEVLPILSTTSNEKETISVEKQLESDTTENVHLNAIETAPILEKCKQFTEQSRTLDKSDDKMDTIITRTIDNNDDKIDSIIPEIETILQEDQVKNQDDTVDNSQKVITPSPTTKTKEDDQSSVRKKRSRIEKQLMIDMVEGHPVLQARAEERLTRRKKSSAAKVIKRKSLAEKMNRVGFESVLKTERKTKEKVKPSSSTTKPLTTSLIVVESQDRLSGLSDDLPASEDIIESSQDSSITTISVKSSKNTVKKVPVVKLSKLKEMKSLFSSPETQRLLKDPNNQMISSSDMTPLLPKRTIDSSSINDLLGVQTDQSKANTECRLTCAAQKTLDVSINSQHETEDISLPKNKTLLEENTELELTEDMVTQPFDDKDGPSEVIISNDDQEPIVTSYSEELPLVGPETQDIAEADTEPMNLGSLIPNATQVSEIDREIKDEILKRDEEKVTMRTETFLTPTTIEVADNACSPLKDATQKKKDFLNDTIEISPIKTLSPVREEKSPSPETNANFVVITLTSPVQSNGEPFNEKSDSPEIFTEEKVSLDNRDQSPPRIEVPFVNTSPSSSLSLKKNKLQMRPSGRAAQMLGLCAPDKLKAIMNAEKFVESDELKKSSTSVSTPVRRNLRILYNSVGDSDCHGDNDNQVGESDQEENENFLNFKRMLPSADSSPAGPILKRKLADITDETTVSPASKVTTCQLFAIAELFVFSKVI